jgi:hypothetical protein
MLKHQSSAPPQSPDAEAYAIDFGAGGKGQEFLIAGWSHPESDYTWTLGKRSIVRLPAPAASRDHSLKLKLGPMVRAGAVAFQRLYVEVNGTLVARLVLREPGQCEIFISADILGQGEGVDIVFHVPDAQPPSALGGSGDSRDLGVWIASLQFQPLATGEPTASAGGADRAMLMDIQSLGENCELGFVQRFVGAEPFGLFRWASTPLPNLLAALAARFEGLGLPENIAVEADGASEFQVLDRKFGFRNHSFAFENTGARKEDIVKRELVRLPFLARLLIEELEQGAKLFCFHDAGRSGREDIERLVAALRAYGPGTLLWISPAGPTGQVGTAEQLHDGLIRGYIDRFQPTHNVRTPSFQAWLETLRAAHRLWKVD